MLLPAIDIDVVRSAVPVVISEGPSKVSERGVDLAERIGLTGAALYDALPAIVFWLSRDRSEVDGNVAFHAYLGDPPGGLKRVDWWGLVHPDDRDTAALAWQGAADRCESVELEFRFGGNGFRWQLARVRPIVDTGSGQPRAWIGVATDIDEQKRLAIELDREVTQRRAALERLRETEALFTQVVEHAEDVFWVGDPVRGRVTYGNPAFERIWGIPLAKLYEDSHVWDAAIVADPDSAPPPSPLPAPCNRDCEYKIRSADGIFRWIRDRRFSIRGASGNGERSAGIAEDITDRKLRELELANLLVRERAARTAAEAVVRAKDEFLGVVSHELRSPLNAIRGWAHVLRQDAINDGVLERAVDAILRNADAQVRVIDDLMDTARIIQGKMSVALRTGSINAVINAAADTQRPMIQAKKLTLTIDLDPGIGLIVMDPERIQQVLVNLLSNAIKFTPEGGRVGLQSRVDETAVVIRVIDDGVGIARPMLPYVFDRFWQGDASRTRRHGGVGLGLAISRQLVELHGGSIDAASDGVGRGATLTVRLPRQEYSALERPPGRR